jgi:Holliday junction resolvase-like predicted endonuclease
MTIYDHKTDWYYEGNVSKKIVSFLKNDNYKIEKDNSDKIKSRGIDIIGSKNGVTILIEVKGYPTEFHTKGKDKGKKKKTSPKLQAKHWLSEAILSTIFNYSKYSSKKNELAIGLPKTERYIDLLEKVKPFFIDKKLDFKVFFVDETGKVSLGSMNK